MTPGWLDEVAAEVGACLDGRGCSPRDLARRLGVSEGCALSYIVLLAAAGRLEIEWVCSPRARHTET